MAESVLIALSGGIDSTMTAHLLKEQGYEVTGVHFQFNNSPTLKIEELAGQLGIRLIKYDARVLFHKEVVGYFTNFYLKGLTPSPCAYCNPNMKWKLLLKLANSENISFVSTGHYINIKKEKGLFRIYKGSDISKDQSYYLWGLNQEVLSRAITPMGRIFKATVAHALKNTVFRDLVNKKESTGLCFANGRNCSDILNEYLPGLDKRVGPGIIVNNRGECIGQHQGYVYYTIGQKQGIKLNTNKKLCVTKIDPERNILEVDTWESLYRKGFTVEDFHFHDISELNGPDDTQVKVRGFGLNPEGNCRIKVVNEKRLEVNLNHPAWAPAPGQPAVFYSGNKLLGGGIIASSQPV